MAKSSAVDEVAVGIRGSQSGGSALDALCRPVTILVGPFGSGKSEIAVNLAFGFANRGVEVTLVDLDLVKPYLRCRVAKGELETRGIRLVAPAGDHFCADLPILVPAARAAARSGTRTHDHLLLDVGGHDLGARVLGSFSALVDRQATDVLFVVNVKRPFAEDVSSLQQMLQDVQAAARMDVTGLIANTHLMDETMPETVCAGIRAARELAAATGIPVRFCAMPHQMVGALGGSQGAADDLPILAMERHIIAPFAMPRRGPVVLQPRMSGG